MFRKVPDAEKKVSEAPLRGLLVRYALAGALFMVVLVHPALEGIHRWRVGAAVESPLREIFLIPVAEAWAEGMWPMSAGLAVAGVAIGLGLGVLHRRLVPVGATDRFRQPDAEGVRSLIAEGETERLEFKSSVRWDRKLGKVNKVLESVIAKTLAGLMNHSGGMLLIGIDDDGTPLGIEEDWSTLKHKNWDGFELHLISLIETRLGGQHCVRVHSECVYLDGKPVAVIEVAAAPDPVYCRDGNVQRYYVRAGNSTRELDAREAVAHIMERGEAPSRQVRR